MKDESRKLYRVLRYDLNKGIVKRWYWFTAFFFFSFFEMAMYLSLASDKVKNGYPSEIEAVCRYFAGVHPMRGPEDVVDIPVLLGMICVGFALLIGDYALRDLNGFGTNILVYSSSRYTFAFSKAIWAMMTVTLAYISIIGGAALSYCIFAKEKTLLETDPRRVNRMFFTEYDISGKELLIHLVVVYIALLLVFVIQMYLSLFLDPVIGFAFTVFGAAVSVMIEHPLLFWNYLMISRGIDIAPDYDYPLFLCIGLLLVLFVGTLSMRYKNVLEKKY